MRVSFDSFAAHAEPAVAANAQDPANLIAACMAGELDDPGNIAVFASFDGGESWSSGGALPLPAGTASADDVSVTFTPDGRGFVAAMATSGLSREDPASTTGAPTTEDGRSKRRQQSSPAHSSTIRR